MWYNEGMKTYYVYILSRPNGKPFYVGKGKGRRISHHEKEARTDCDCRKCRVIRKIWRNGGEVMRHIVFNTELEEEAFAYEAEMIALFGRKSLTNLTDGGDGVRGYAYSKEYCEARRELAKAQMSDPSARNRISNAVRSLWADENYRARVLASFRSEEGRQNRSKSQRAAWSNEELLERHASMMRKRWEDPEYKARVSGSIAQRQSDPEYRMHKREEQKEVWSNDELKRKHSKQAQKRWDTMSEEQRKEIGTNMSRAWTPERRAAQAERMRQRHLKTNYPQVPPHQ